MKGKKLLYNSMKAVCSFALALAVLNVNSACFFCCYQPEVPEQLNKFKK